MDEAEARDILGVSDVATWDEIRRAYYRLSRKVHSDAGGSDALFRQVATAYDTLARAAASPRADGADDVTSSRRDVPRSHDARATSPFSTWARANPSLALVFAGLLWLFVVVRADAETTLLPLIGAVCLFVGATGLMGAARVRARGDDTRGGALLRSQLRAGAPRLATMVGRTILVALVTSLTLGALVDHSRKARSRR